MKKLKLVFSSLLEIPTDGELPFKILEAVSEQMK